MIFKILVLLICMQIVKVSSQGGQSENTEPNSNLEENSRKNGYEKFNTRDDNQAIGSENAVSNLNPGDRRPSKPRIEKPGDRRPGKDLKKKVQSLIDNVDKFEHEIEKKKKNLLKSVKIAIQSSCTDDKNDEENSRKNGHEKFSISDDNKERKALNPSSNLNPKDETNIVERKTGDNSEKRDQVLSQGDRTWSHDRDFKKNVQSLIDTVDEFELEFEKTTTDLLKSMKLAIQNPCTDDKNNGDKSENTGSNLNSVDGKYGEWNSWGTCSVSCGKGDQTRQRECNNPKPQYGGITCELLGSNQEIRNCVDKECPIDGKYGEWNSWGTCSVSCGKGDQTRQRECDSPKPQYGGNTCELLGSNQEISNCVDKECPIDGKYGEWNSWGTCSVSCGKGVQARQRECDSPKPIFGGNTCESLGSNQEIQNCIDKECPITVWGKWSECSNKCHITSSDCDEQKERTCVTALEPGLVNLGDACIKNAKESIHCLTHPSRVLCRYDQLLKKYQKFSLIQNCNNFIMNTDIDL